MRRMMTNDEVNKKIAELQKQIKDVKKEQSDILRSCVGRYIKTKTEPPEIGRITSITDEGSLNVNVLQRFLDDSLSVSIASRTYVPDFVDFISEDEFWKHFQSAFDRFQKEFRNR